MKHLAHFATALLLALPTGCSWALVYPHPELGAGGLAALLAGAGLWVVVLTFGSRPVRAWAGWFAAASVAAGLVTTAWSALSWTAGVWYPALPRVLHKLFDTDGEASYNASDGQLFILLFVFFMAVAVALGPRVSAAGKAWARTRRRDERPGR